MIYVLLVVTLLVIYCFFIEIYFRKKKRVAPPSSLPSNSDIMGQSKFDLRQFAISDDETLVSKSETDHEDTFAEETLISLDESLLETGIEDEEMQSEMAEGVSFQELEKVIKVIKLGGNENEQDEIATVVNKLQGSELLNSFLEQIEGSREKIDGIMRVYIGNEEE